MAEGSQDPLVPYDLAVLMQQAGDSRGAIGVFESATHTAAPEYAELAMVRAYRDLGQFEAAEKLAVSGSIRFPKNPIWATQRALVLADMRRTEEALRLLRTAPALAAPVAEHKLAEAYAQRMGGRSFEALRLYMDVLRLDPANQSARGEAASLLRELGGVHGAATLIDTQPPLATGAQRLPLGADQAGTMVRWGGDIHPSDPARRFEGTDAALQRIAQLMAEAKNTPGTDPGVLTHLQLDRLVALRDRVRMAEVVLESDALIAAGITLPSHALEARADALLYLHRPEEAAQAYRQVIELDPANLDAPYGLFYAEVESEDFAAAYATLDRILAATAATYNDVGGTRPRPNPDYLDAEIAAGLARYYADQLGEAESRIAPLAAAAPTNATLRLANATVMEARGHPRAAREEAHIAASLDPRDLGAQLILVQLDREAFRFEAARARLQRLQALYPESLDVRRQAEELDAETGWQFELEVSPGWSNGSSSNSSGQDMNLNTTLWAPPIDDHWRVFLLDDYLYGHPEEGFVERNRTGLGAEWRSEDLRASLYGTYSVGELEDPGGGFTIDWSLDDHLMVSLAGEIFALETPLRALFTDTKANQVSAAATYRWHESRELVVRGAYLDFNDGNEQAQAGLSFQQRLIDIPHFDLVGRLELGASSNSRQDVSYYAPESDATATAGFLAEHVTWRRYDDSFVQAFSLDAGVYAEEGYGTDWVGAFGYEHRWTFSQQTEFRYGAMLTRNVYDGDAEEGLIVTLGLQRKF